MSDVRSGAVTLKGNSVDLAGAALSTGDAAPDFSLQKQCSGRSDACRKRRPDSHHCYSSVAGHRDVSRGNAEVQ